MGKLNSNELRKLLTCIKKDPRVTIPPLPGFDAGVHRLGDKYVVVATDPCMGVPQEWFGYLLVHYTASDVSLSGATPEFCTITLLGPQSADTATFQKIMKQICKAAEELNMTIVRGHTGAYDSLNDFVGVCTAYGTVEPENLMTPANAKPEDLILVTKSLGLETVINFCLTHREWAYRLFGAKEAENLSKLVFMQSCVKEAKLLAKTGGVHALHDTTEGGFITALNELAQASGVGFEVDREKLPILPQAKKLQETFGLSDDEIWAMSSTGTIVAAISPTAKEYVVGKLSENGASGVSVGKFTKDKKRRIINKGRKTPFPATAKDPYTRILSGKV